MKPLAFINVREPKTDRTSSLAIYGNKGNGLIHVIGNLEHNAGIEPLSITDANRLIAWLEDWKLNAKKESRPQ